MTADTQLLVAQAARDEAILDYDINQIFERVFSASDVSPEARSNLRRVLKVYAKNPHPYRACIVDNMKHFGPGKTEKVCATLKDMIRSTSRWLHTEPFMGSDLDPDPCDYTLTHDEQVQIFAAFSDADWAALEEVIVDGR